VCCLIVISDAIGCIALFGMNMMKECSYLSTHMIRDNLLWWYSNFANGKSFFGFCPIQTQSNIYVFFLGLLSLTYYRMCVSQGSCSWIAV